jgi:N-acetylneuraminic acid mutarotase
LIKNLLFLVVLFVFVGGCVLAVRGVLGLFLAVVFLFSVFAGVGEAFFVVESTWETKASMPERLASGVQAGTVDGKIYVMRTVMRDNTLYSVNFEYNPATDTWTEKTPMTTPRNGFGFAVYQNKIYTIGGSYYVNEVYDPVTDTWETREPLPRGRRELAAVRAAAVDGKIHVLGGGVHDIYDIATDSWSVGEPKPYPLPYLFVSLTVLDGKIYVLGRNATQIYDPKSDSWSLGAAAPLWVSSPGVGATSGVNALKRIYLFGGVNTTGQYSDYTQVYDPVGDSWAVGESMLTARVGPAVVVVDDVFYVMGGGVGGWFGIIGCDVNEKYIPFGYGSPDPIYGEDEDVDGVVPDPSCGEDNDKGANEVVERASVVPIVVFVGVVVLVSLGLIVYFSKRKSF